MTIEVLTRFAATKGVFFPKEIRLGKFNVDSRNIQAGDIFCAIEGQKVDGHLFVEEAFAKGAAAAVVSKACSTSHKDRLIHVNNVIETLQNLAKEKFEEKRPKLVFAVTGSVGKTTVKEFLATLLAGDRSVFKTPGNNNSQIGLPLAILNEFQSEEAAVLEMGMTAPGQIKRLVDLFPPDIAIITKVALVHAINFESINEIAKAKGEIFSHKQTVAGVYDAEMASLVTLPTLGPCAKHSFGFTQDAEFSLRKEAKGWVFHSPSYSEIVSGLPFEHPHHLHNVLASLSAIACADLSFESVKERMSLLTLPEKRGHLCEKRGVVFLNDSYNASFPAVSAALTCLPKSSGKKIAVLGSMLELGKFSERFHAEAGRIALNTLDHLICYGEEFAPAVKIWREAGRRVDDLSSHKQIVERLRAITQPGDVVLVKGSRAKELWKVIEDF